VRPRLTALIVDPHATPTIMFESTNCERSRPAVRATRSRRSTSLTISAIGTTCATTRCRSLMRCSSIPRRSSGELMRMSTRPLSRAKLSSRDTDDREVPSSCAMTSMVLSCM